MLLAARLNSFQSRPGKPGRLSVPELLARAASVRGLSAVDLNYPDHLQEPDTVRVAADLGLAINGFAMRYYTDPALQARRLHQPGPGRRGARRST